MNQIVLSDNLTNCENIGDTSNVNCLLKSNYDIIHAIYLSAKIQIN